MSFRDKSAALICFVVLLATARLTAQVAGGTLTVQAVVPNNCSLAVQDLAFGNYNPVITNQVLSLRKSTWVRIRCTNGDPYSIAISQGQHPDPTSTASNPHRRMMNSSGALMNYSLYRNIAYSQPWGEDLSARVSGIGNGQLATLSIYGTVSAGQPLPPGLYTDVVTVTIYY
jgi:spore coat protein U-like protein